MELGFKVVKKILPQFEENHPYSLNLSDVYKNITYENECIKQFSRRPTYKMIDTGVVPYIVSLTENRDFLPMWSLYGNKCKGVCLKFNLPKLIKDINTSMGFVSYGEDENGYVKDFYLPELYNFEVAIHNKEMTIDEKIRELSLLCLCISPFVKNKSWAYENEFRIECYHNYMARTDEGISKGLLLSGTRKEKIERFIELSIKANTLEEIIIGSLANYNVIEHILKNELNECNLGDVMITQSSISITE